MTDEREVMEFDVVIVGAGPAGLAAAIRLKQRSPDLTVAILEKGSEVGAHILSGAVIDPVGLDTLLPGWRNDATTPVKVKVKHDRFVWLGEAGAIRIPNIVMPPLMSNHGNYIASLGDTCRWLARKAEALGVEIFPGFAAAEVLTNKHGAVIGVATGDMGVARDGSHKSTYQRGIALHARYTLIAEGARGSLAKRLTRRFGLDLGREPQKYGIGIKELWEVSPARHREGTVQHTFGFPLDGRTGGGSFLYHLDNNQVAVGFVVHLNYKNPHLSPFEEFQKFKAHPAIAPIFAGGKRIAYGARAITEGGFQSVPKLTFPGGALIGCSAGFVNVPRIKGSHNAILSGIAAADHVAQAIADGREHDEISGYDEGWRSGPIGRDLYPVRNVKPLWSKFGTLRGVALGGLDMWLNTFGLSLFGTLPHGGEDHAATEAGVAAPPAPYAKADGAVRFDRLSSVFLANTVHDEDQPVHLRVRDMNLQVESELRVYDGPSALYCPAAVYEWVEEAGAAKYVINAANCVHCKTCDIKDPNQNIDWVPPEGGSGPNYPNM
jgi:electron-transferring-flavoprotein dehydrogenase